MTTPRKRRMTIVGLIVLAVMAAWIGSVVWSIDDWSRDWSTNFAEISLDAKDPALQSPLFNESPEELAKRIEDWVGGQSQWAFHSLAADEGIISLHLTRSTRVFRFVDDIHVLLEPIDGRTRLTAESGSRLGKGDLGQNPRNLKELLGGLN